MIDAPLTWLNCSTIEGIPAPERKQSKSPAEADEPLAREVRSIPALIAQKVASANLEHFKARVRALPTQSTQNPDRAHCNR